MRILSYNDLRWPAYEQVSAFPIPDKSGTEGDGGLGPGRKIQSGTWYRILKTDGTSSAPHALISQHTIINEEFGQELVSSIHCKASSQRSKYHF